MSKAQKLKAFMQEAGDFVTAGQIYRWLDKNGFMLESDDLMNEVNAAWKRLYGGMPVNDPKKLCLRVLKIAEDRDCWLANHKQLQKAYNKMEDEMRELRDIFCSSGKCGNMATTYGYDGSPLCEACEKHEIDK